MKRSLLTYAALTFGLLLVAASLYIHGLSLKAESFGTGLAYVLGAVTALGMAIIASCMTAFSWLGVERGERPLMYAWNVLQLWLSGKIKWRTLVHGLRERPIALAGVGGAYIVDPTFE